MSKGGKRRGNGEGTLYERADGRWQGQLTLANGHRHSVYGHSRAEVVAKLRTLASDQDRGLPVGLNQRLTLAAFLLDWCARHGGGVRPRTRRRYRELLEIHIIPQLGRTPLARLTPIAIERRLHELHTQPAQRNGKPLAAATVNRVRSALHVALQDAVDKGILARNPCDAAKAPKEERYQATIYTREQCLAFLDAIMGDRLEALYLLALTTAARQGELLALTWDALTIDHLDHLGYGAARLERGIGPGEHGGLEVGPQKTASSRRTVSLLPDVVAALRALRARQAEERLALGAAWLGRHHRDASGASSGASSGAAHFVFTRPGNGAPYDGRNFTRREFHRLLSRAGLPRIRFHELRHTMATLNLQAGTPLAEVSKWLGHANQRTTYLTYSHVLPGNDIVATNTARILSRRKPAADSSDSADSSADSSADEE